MSIKSITVVQENLCQRMENFHRVQEFICCQMKVDFKTRRKLQLGHIVQVNSTKIQNLKLRLAIKIMTTKSNQVEIKSSK